LFISKKKCIFAVPNETETMNIFDADYLFSLVTGILFMTQLAWAVLFLLGRTVIQRKEYEHHPAIPLRWWTGILAAALAMAFLFAFVIRSCLESDLNFYFIYFDMLAIPIGALVMVVLVTPQPITQKRIWANILPFVVCCTIGVIVQKAWLFYLISAMIACYIIAMMVYIVIFGKRHEEEIKDKYSSLEGRSIKWMIITAPILLVVLILNYGIYIASHNPYAPIIYYCIAFGIWNYIYTHIYQMVVISENDNENEDEDENENYTGGLTPCVVDDNENSAFLEKLHDVCEQQELFTNPDLTRDELARLMNMGHTKFSQLLKDSTGLNFYDYINRLRIQKAIQLIDEGKMDMWSIGKTVGYSYRSTFYRAFATIQGCTPSEYQTRDSVGDNLSGKRDDRSV